MKYQLAALFAAIVSVQTASALSLRKERVIEYNSPDLSCQTYTCPPGPNGVKQTALPMNSQPVAFLQECPAFECFPVKRCDNSVKRFNKAVKSPTRDLEFLVTKEKHTNGCPKYVVDVPGSNPVQVDPKRPSNPVHGDPKP